jgi:hypothetical protein
LPGLTLFEGRVEPETSDGLMVEGLQDNLQALASRPVLQQAMRLADDKLDLPLFDETFN